MTSLLQPSYSTLTPNRVGRISSPLLPTPFPTKTAPHAINQTRYKIVPGRGNDNFLTLHLVLHCMLQPNINPLRTSLLAQVKDAVCDCNLEGSWVDTYDLLSLFRQQFPELSLYSDPCTQTSTITMYTVKQRI